MSRARATRGQAKAHADALLGFVQLPGPAGDAWGNLCFVTAADWLAGRLQRWPADAATRHD
ncbi:hypothetical protein AB0I66_41700 [Streptomyces sp. NPDC050439]|uniref:hypothetical protein n=1 Tax=unclassified Streptomyces TaxID=2593676 RepID=UPI003448C9DD